MNERRAMLAAALALLVPSYPVAATEMSGVLLPESARPQGSAADIRLRGSGIFRFFFLRYYVCGLYAEAGLADAAAILEGDASRRVALVALRRISAFEFLWGLDQGLADNLSPAQAQSLREPLEEVRQTIRAVGAIARGARVSIDYAPGAGTRIVVDEQPRGASVAGKPVSDALLRVWIGERPLDSGLKRELLGG